MKCFDNIHEASHFEVIGTKRYYMYYELRGNMNSFQIEK